MKWVVLLLYIFDHFCLCHFCSSVWSFTSFLKDSIERGILKPALRID